MSTAGHPAVLPLTVSSKPPWALNSQCCVDFIRTCTRRACLFCLCMFILF